MLGFKGKEVPGGHILAHTGRKPHHSPGSVRQSSPRYWAQQAQDSYSGLRLDETDRQTDRCKGEWIISANVSKRGLFFYLSLNLFSRLKVTLHHRIVYSKYASLTVFKDVPFV